MPGDGGGGWAELRERARAVLAETAAARAVITYGDLVDRVGGPVAGGGSGERDLAALLRDVSIAEEAAGRGLLSAVVVRERGGGGGMPGGGFFRLAASCGRDVRDRRAAWQAELERVWSAFEAPGGAGER